MGYDQREDVYRARLEAAAVQTESYREKYFQLKQAVLEFVEAGGKVSHKLEHLAGVKK